MTDAELIEEFRLAAEDAAVDQGPSRESERAAIRYREARSALLTRLAQLRKVEEAASEVLPMCRRCGATPAFVVDVALYCARCVPDLTVNREDWVESEYAPALDALRAALAEVGK